MDPHFIFAKEINDTKAFPLPLMKYLRHDNFVLENYTLNRTACKPLAKAFGMFSHIATVRLRANMMNDVGISEILKSLDGKGTKIIHYERNEFGKKFVDALWNSFFEDHDNSLKEL